MSAPPVVELVIRAVGVPAPQGSKTPVRRGKKTVLIEDNPATEPWRQTVIAAARSAMAAHGSWIRLTGPVAVECVFIFDRPRSVRRELPCVRPDADKLERAVFDSLTKAGVWQDDALVVDWAGRKRYARGRQVPGVRIRVRPAEQVIV